MTEWQPGEFSLRDERQQRLLGAFVTAYSKKQKISDFLLTTRVREDEVNFDGTVRSVWIDVLRTAVQAKLLDDLVQTALQDPQVASVHDRFREYLAGGGPGPAPPLTDDGPLTAAATRLLTRAGRPRAPVVIALQLEGEELREDELPRATCHLVVSLTPDQAATIEGLARDALAGSGSIAEIVDAGSRIWARLTEAGSGSRLRALPGRIAGAGLAQPVAWCGRPGLLERMRGPLQIAHTGGATAHGFLAAGAGHYLMPVHPAGTDRDARTLPRREWAKDPEITDLHLPGGAGADWLGQLTGTDVAIVAHHGDRPVLTELDAAARDPAGPPIRALFAFGPPPDVARIDALLDVVPFVGTADLPLADPALRAALRAALCAHAATSAMPCIVAAVRAAWLGAAIERGDAPACRLGLALSSWSWIGLPLFARSFGEVPPAAHPHLMVLRTVAEPGWYFDRRERILEPYQAGPLATAAPGKRFHLYLSGAGGTGKSCLLRHVHDRIDDNPGSIAVWYRVDSPSSSWENVESRVREETIDAIAETLDKDTVTAVRALGGDLGDFLTRTVALLRAGEEFDFDEIAVFIDQLERTFESGDEPNPIRLGMISKALIDLLDKVGTDNGVRVFVASRKQYLPDFLGSFRAAAASGLEFNVLQTISDEHERVEFVQKVLGWCADQQLVAPGVTMRDEAAKRLVGQVDGHPLNTVLALIQLLSEHTAGAITEEHVTRSEPWNKLFLLDLRAVERDELDWYFLLAMAHARTEIVRFEEVWWRIRMVNAELTRRIDDLRSNGVKERLWLLGILGRTIHARPDIEDPVGFVEFFHANLRDYLLREVMGQGRAGPGGAAGPSGAPPTWRALDRLSGFAHDWAQTPQLLLADEIRGLMEHRNQVIEARPTHDGEALPFHLLFLRDSPGARERLRMAAQECFALSALVHDEAGKWAVEELFPDGTDRVLRCGDWLRRCPEHRSPVLRYLVGSDAPAARDLLITALLGLDRGQHAELAQARPEPGTPQQLRVDVLLGLDRLSREELQQAVALVLTEPLYAAGWRNAVLLATLAEALRRADNRPERLTAHVTAFVVAACGRDRETLAGVISYCVDRLTTSDDANERALGRGLAGFRGLDGWLDEAADGPPRRAVPVAAVGAPLALLVGGALRAELADERLADWSQRLRDALGVPLPELTVLAGEAEPDVIELHSFGQRIARGVFCPGRQLVSKRLWELSGGQPGDAVQTVLRGADVLWLSAAAVAAHDDRIATEDFEQALVGWLEEHCRRSFDLIFDVELEIAFLREVTTTEDARRRLVRIGRALLRAVLVSLIEEGVPFGERRAGILQELADLAQRSSAPGPVTQKIREYAKDGIWRTVAGLSGEVTTILLAQPLEERLANLVDVETGRFREVPAEATQLDAAVRRTLVRLTQDAAGPPPVLLTVPRLRPALAWLVRRMDHRLPVLSFTELPADLISVTGGLVDVTAERPAP